MVGLLGALTPEEQYGEGLLAPMQRGHGLGLLGGIRQLMGPSVMSRMQEANTAQQARLASGERSPTPLTEENMWLADDVAGGLLGPMALALGTGSSMAESIAKLLREGRAAEVTDEMLGALGPNDQRRLFELYESGATGMDLPMDEASRMARAESMGLDTEAPRYHGTPHERELSNLQSGSWERVAGEPFYNPDGSANKNAMNWAPSRKQQVWFADDPAYANSYARRASTDRGAIYPAITRDSQPGSVRGEYRVTDPSNIRSRFARFDPRLKHNADLLASLAGAGLLGSLAYQPDEAP